MVDAGVAPIGTRISRCERGSPPPLEGGVGGRGRARTAGGFDPSPNPPPQGEGENVFPQSALNVLPQSALIDATGVTPDIIGPVAGGALSGNPGRSGAAVGVLDPHDV